MLHRVRRAHLVPRVDQEDVLPEVEGLLPPVRGARGVRPRVEDDRLVGGVLGAALEGHVEPPAEGIHLAPHIEREGAPQVQGRLDLVQRLQASYISDSMSPTTVSL